MRAEMIQVYKKTKEFHLRFECKSANRGFVEVHFTNVDDSKQNGFYKRIGPEQFPHL